MNLPLGLEAKISQPLIQSSFNAGELAPQLYARTDFAKYHSAAALLRNFFVDYRGGASTRPGTKYVLQCKSLGARIIPFQASNDVSYLLELGDEYIRFYNQGQAILEPSFVISGATQANPLVVTVTGNNFSVGDWGFISGVQGMTQVNGRYYQVIAVSGASVTLGYVGGNPIDSTVYSAYTSSGTIGRVYTLASPFAVADVDEIKFAQASNQLILVHPSYPPQDLTITSAANWAINPITFGTPITEPTGVSISQTVVSGGTSNTYYSYVVTAVDINGNESAASTVASDGPVVNISVTQGTNRISWTAVANAVSYNVYKAVPSYVGVQSADGQFGFIGNTGINFLDDTNIGPDFSESPPVIQDPFAAGSGIVSYTLTAIGSYAAGNAVPAITLSGGSPTLPAQAQAIMQASGNPTVNNPSSTSGYSVGDLVSFPFGIVLRVASVNAFSHSITGWSSFGGGSSGGAFVGSTLPSNPLQGVGDPTANVNISDWIVSGVESVNPGAGYTSTPTVVFNYGGATATATLGTSTSGYPSVVGFYQQRMVLAAPNSATQTFYMSQPGSYFNYDISNPIEADDAITATLVSGQVENIKSLLPVSAGLAIFTDRASWLINGGFLGSAVTPSSVVANKQSYNGANDVPPIVCNFDILYVQEKGSVVRDSTYNYYAQIYTGVDVSLLSSHLFYGHFITQWAWAEEPFKVVWAIRDDGVLLSFTFMKEQDFTGWAHSDTQGLYTSVATIVEDVTIGTVDAVYLIAQRVVEGVTVQYIERMVDRVFTNGWENVVCTDASFTYNGMPVNSFAGGEALAGLTVTGLADGSVIPQFVMPDNGLFTIPVASSVVSIGLAFLPQLQTLPIDVGDPTIQSKEKKIPVVTLPITETLGLSIGSTFGTLTPMKDLVIGKIGSMTNQLVTGLVTGQARTTLDPVFSTQGQYCIQQNLPYPATILGVIPQLAVGDTAR